MATRRSLVRLRLGVAILAVALAIQRFMVIDAASHSASDTLRPWFIEVAIIAVLATALVLVVEALWARRRPA